MPRRAAAFDARDELLHRERLHEVVVRADLERVHTVVLGAPRGDDDDRRADPLASRLLDHLPAVDARQHQVEDADVRLLVAEACEPRLAVGHADRVEAGLLEVARHAVGDHVVVLDDEHLRHHGNDDGPRGWRGPSFGRRSGERVVKPASLLGVVVRVTLLGGLVLGGRHVDEDDRLAAQDPREGPLRGTHLGGVVPGPAVEDVALAVLRQRVERVVPGAADGRRLRPSRRRRGRRRLRRARRRCRARRRRDRSPGPLSTWSLPEPPSTRSFPAPPLTTSLPCPPNTVSSPASPSAWSLPLPGAEDVVASAPVHGVVAVERPDHVGVSCSDEPVVPRRADDERRRRHRRRRQCGRDGACECHPCSSCSLPCVGLLTA